MDSTGLICDSATVAGSVTVNATASATPTAVIAGTGKPLNISLFSGLFTELGVGGTLVPAGHGVAASALRVELPTDGTGHVVAAVDQTTPGTTNAVAIANIPTITPFSTNSVTTSAAAIAAHISATAGQYGYLSGVTISGLGATATSAINCNIQGLIGGTRQFWIQIPAGVAVALNPIQLSWNPPVQSSAVNTLIQCNVPSFGTGNVEASVVMDGYTSASAQPLP